MCVRDKGKRAESHRSSAVVCATPPRGSHMKIRLWCAAAGGSVFLSSSCFAAKHPACSLVLLPGLRHSQRNWLHVWVPFDKLCVLNPMSPSILSCMMKPIQIILDCTVEWKYSKVLKWAADLYKVFSDVYLLDTVCTTMWHIAIGGYYHYAN